ncbi:response regulator [Spirilliplanes yamanashiensis]|uniref:Two-component system response regulator n=1 Tax=Spirilliplanes yamanashiensis TaxID=42233 RepID=A0A8J3Y9Y3_9ACTN|nr:response regulator [Spirilliplanes yamanashiensis]MDP9815671.1 CheY-like chemotaxis protein [Spirilliplanes yamanashiensis]GIJ03925.1 two-component system response regulator [Spirilliplanes yamanashiensis]
MSEYTPIEILLIEDDPGDVLLTREAFDDHKLRNRLVVFGDGREALCYLQRRAPYADATPPDLILLDLNLPGLDGRELLAALAADPLLARIPVVVLTNSLAERDILRSRALRVTDYVAKPVDFYRLIEVVQRVEQFALSVVREP